MKLKLSLGANERTFFRQATKNHVRNLTLGTLAFALAPLAQASADTVTVFDSATQNWTASSDNSSTADGVTTIRNTTSAPNNANTDYFDLGAAIQTGSGVWTLTMSVTENRGSVTANTVWGGFGNITSTTDPLGNDPTHSPGGISVNLPGPSFFQRSNVTTAPDAATQTLLRSGAPSNGTLIGNYAPVFLTPAQTQAVEPQNTAPGGSDTQIYQLVLDTSNAQWTAKFLVNGIAEQFTIDGVTTDTIVYATDPTITGFGIGGNIPADGSFVFQNITLTDDVTAAVPEPSTWAMMVLGFAGLGFMTYRRKSQKGGLNFRLV